MSLRHRRIAAEEAFAIPEQFEAIRRVIERGTYESDARFLGKLIEREIPVFERIMRQLMDLEYERLRLMDEAGVDMHLLSLVSPGVQMLPSQEAIEIAALANDRLADRIRCHPTRFAGLASIAPQAPEQAALEIERAIGTLGLNGVMINSHTNGEYLDEPRFAPILEAASALDVPIYIHPRGPSAGMAAPYMKYALETAIWGHGAEASLHAVRIIMSGLLDRFPKLRFVLGRLGEGLPFWLWRLDNVVVRSPRAVTLKRRPSDYFRDNFFVTTAGINSIEPLQFCVSVLGADRVLWGVDYPFLEHPEAVEMLEHASLADEDKRKIFGANAEHLFRIAVAAETA